VGVLKWSLAWGGEFNRPVRGNDAQLYVGADASYRASYSSIATPSPYFVVDGYNIANFRAGIATATTGTSSAGSRTRWTRSTSEPAGQQRAGRGAIGRSIDLWYHGGEEILIALGS
jgi:hypothetical protein